MSDNSFLQSIYTSLFVSTFVVLVNNYILYTHCCKKSTKFHCMPVASPCAKTE